MGIRRLRARLDQLQGKANLTMDDAREVLAAASELLADVQDGVGVKLHIDTCGAMELLRIASGKPGTIPITVAVDPAYDTLPSELCEFVGGPYGGKRYQVTKTEETTITLAGGHKYIWDGYRFRYQGGTKHAQRKDDQ